MANEIRVRSAVLAGTTTDNPLLVGATTLNSARLADVPAIGATEHYPITLDPLGASGAPEEVWITAHTAASTSATIVRAREGTTARQHAAGTTWYHGPTGNDYTRVVTTAPSGTGLPFDGQTWYHQTEKRLYLSEAGAGVRIGHTTAAGRTGVTLARNATQTVNSGTDVLISWDTESFDSDGGFAATSTTAYTCPSGCDGDYGYDLRVAWSGAPSAGNHGVLVNGSQVYGVSPGTYSGVNKTGLQGFLTLAATDTVSFVVVQNSGSSKTITATLSLHRLIR